MPFLREAGGGGVRSLIANVINSKHFLTAPLISSINHVIGPTCLPVTPVLLIGQSALLAALLATVNLGYHVDSVKKVMHILTLAVMAKYFSDKIHYRAILIFVL